MRDVCCGVIENFQIQLRQLTIKHYSNRRENCTPRINLYLIIVLTLHKTHLMFKRILLLAIPCILATLVVSAQTIQPCIFGSSFEGQVLSDSVRMNQLRMQSEYIHNYNSSSPTVQSSNVLMIPVVVHIMHNSGEAVGQGLNISYAQVLSQIARMNADFANDTIYTQLPSGDYAVHVGIQFCLAQVPMGPAQWTDTLEPGVMRYVAPTNVLDHISDLSTSVYVNPLLNITHPNSTYFPFDRYLNIWTLNQITDPSGINHAAGYSPHPISQFPNYPLDGIVMDAHMFGDNTVNNNNFPIINPTYNTGNICTHEAGHYLNLWHTFTGGCSGTLSTDCTTGGDFICDTPPDTNQTASCVVTNSCSETYFAVPTQNHPDMIENYMTWHDDNCINTFTNEQGLVMRNYLQLYRSTLIDPVNLSLTGVASPNGCIPAQLLATIVAPSLICANVADTFNTYTGIGFLATSWQWQFAGGTPSSSTSQNPIVFWTNPGPHTVVLTAYDAQNDSIVDSISVYVNPCSALASDQGHWYFGWKAGLDFSSGVGVRDDAAYLNNTLISGESAVAESDTAGALIFYSNGRDLWDRNHNLAITGMFGDTSNSKSQIVSVPHPLHANWWYIFTGVEYESSPGPIYYSIVSDSAGTMYPIVLNDTLPRLAGCASVGEAISAVPHCNGRDYWLITRAKGSSIWESTLLVYLISPAGITNPSGSGVFPSTYILPSGATSVSGTIKGSPDNTHLVVNHTGLFAISVLDFNNSTGQISNERTVASPSYLFYFGASFSPDGRYVYYAHQQSPQIFRTDITQPTLTMTTIATLGVGEVPGEMQLGPDSMLYVVTIFDRYISRFTNPSSLTPAFTAQAVDLGALYFGVANRNGIPNMIDGIVPPATPLTFNITYLNCSTIVFFPSGCWGPSYNFAWDFGDGSPIDTSVFGTHTYATTGLYTITLTLSVGTYSFTPIQQQVAIQLTPPVIAGPTVVCATQLGFSTYSLPPNLQSYQWSVTGGVILSSDTFASCDVSWISSGTISCVVNNGANCSFTVTLAVTVNPNPIADAGQDTLYTCANGFVYLGGNPTASGGLAPYQYNWFPSALVNSANVANPTANILAPTTFTVNVSDAHGCTSSDIIYVGIDTSLTAPVISFSSIPQTCDNGPIINLGGYVSPAGGTFSGNAVTGTLFNPANAVVPDSNTVYYLYIDTITGCSALDSNFVYVYNCCNTSTGINTTNGQTSSSYGPAFSGTPVPVRINGTFYVTNTFFITGYSGANTVRCAPNATIIVKAGARLVIQSGTILAACDDMWNGIIVEPGGQLEILTGASIRDAKQAVVSKNGAKFKLDQALLRDNYQNIIVEPHNGQGLHPGTIVRSRIVGSTLSLAPYAGVKTYSGMEITGVDSIYVGIPTTTFDENEFNGMDFGIITNTANVYIRNNQFKNISSNVNIAIPSCCATGGCGPTTNCNPAPKGTAIWSTGSNVVIGGPSLPFQNRFNICTRGILAENGINATIRNNKFQNINSSNIAIPTYCVTVRKCKSNVEIISDNLIKNSKNGIVFGFSALTSAMIESNDINDVGGTGIQVTQTSQCPVSIGFNTINATATTTGKYGIRVSNAVISNSLPYVEIHGNITKKVEKHIWVTNFPYILIDNSNNMQFANGVPATAQFGVQVQNSHDALVDGNTVMKNGAVPTDTNYRKRLYGISMETNCYNTTVSNNGLFKTGTGIQYFNANNFPSTVSCNSLTNTMRGVSFTNAYIGNQGAPISGPFPNGIAQDNQWTIQPAQNSLYKALWADNGSPTANWYYRNNTNVYHPNTLQYPYGNYYPFVGPLPNAPSLCVQPCPTCLVQQNLSTIAARTAPYDTLAYSSMFLSDQTVYAQLRQNQALMSMGTQYDTTLTAFYNQMTPDNVGLIDEAYLKVAQGDTTGAALAKDGIIPRGDPDLNHKLVLDIYLRSWARQQFYFLPQDSAVLLAIATQNVTYGGTAVYDARVMLDIDIDDIGFGSTLRMVVSDTNEFNSIGEIYPNPTTGETNFEIEVGENESGYIVVTDVFGRPVETKTIQSGFNSIELNLTDLPSGVYLYRAIINEETRQTGKIVLEK